MPAQIPKITSTFATAMLSYVRPAACIMPLAHKIIRKGRIKISIYMSQLRWQ